MLQFNAHVAARTRGGGGPPSHLGDRFEYQTDAPSYDLTPSDVLFLIFFLLEPRLRLEIEDRVW